MVANDERSERIKIKVLSELDKMDVHRKRSYSKRIEYLLQYCKMDKNKFNKWIKKEDDKR